MKEEVSSHSDLVACMKDISVVYGDFAALYEVNLDVNKGDFIGICGPNGSGKTTLLKTMVRLVQPIAGRMMLYDQEITDTIPAYIRFRIGYVPQITNIDRNFPALVKDVVEMGRYAKAGLARRITRVDKQKAMEALQLVDMEQSADRPIGHLSGGQQQRVLIAQALAAEAEVLLLDEFTSALDFRMTEDIMELLFHLNHTHKITIITVGHNIEILRAYCNRIVCINKVIAFDGSPKDQKLDEAINKIFN
ncbi:MAG: ABC transporter ATP-binding protein [Candidatus Heimdallarchaeota archaeon]|nr:ABC transporter ATP-binding protein [Candidatus Heimdallarchaeota archaeon]